MYYPDWSFTIKPPCCGVCQIRGDRVDLSYWPTPAPTQAVTALANDVGFTFVSPSVYAVFRSLAAYDLCGYIGQTFENKTLSFGPTELSTSPAIHAVGVLFYQYLYNWTSFNYADVTNSNCTDLVASSDGTETRYYNPCFPFLSLPPQVLKIDQRWSTCVHEFGAFYDPPRALTPVEGLTVVEASKTSAVDPPQGSQKATAGQTVVLSVAASTPANAVPTPSKAHPQANPGLLPSSPPKANPPQYKGPVNPKPKDSTPEFPTLKDPAPKDPALKDPTPKHPIPKDPTPKDPTPKDPYSKGLNTPNSPANNPPDPKAPLIFVQGVEVTEGGPVITQDGKIIAYSSGYLHVGSSAMAVPTLVALSYTAASNLNGLKFSIVANAPPINPPAVIQNPNPVTPAIYVQGVKLTEGAPAITQGGIAIAYSSDYLHVGSSVVAIPKTIPPSFTSASALGGLSFSIVPSSGNALEENPSPPKIYVQGVKLTEGGTPITQDGKLIAYSSGNLHVGSSVLGVPTLAAPSYASTFILNGLTFSVVGPRPADINPLPTPALTIGHSLVTATPNLQLVVAGQTLIAGGTAQTVSGTRISLAPSTSAIVIGSSTSLLVSQSQTAAIILVLGSSIYTATLSPNLAIGSQILSPGAVITVGGTPISLDVQSTDIAIGTSTVAQDISLGALIMSAFGPLPSSPLSPIVSATPTLSPGLAAPSPPSTTLNIDNVALSLNPTQAIINNTPYPIGPGVSPTTFVVGNETLSVGPGGVGFRLTTVPVPSVPGGGLEGFTGGAERGLAGFRRWWWLLGGVLGVAGGWI